MLCEIFNESKTELRVLESRSPTCPLWIVLGDGDTVDEGFYKSAHSTGSNGLPKYTFSKVRYPHEHQMGDLPLVKVHIAHIAHIAHRETVNLSKH